MKHIFISENTKIVTYCGQIITLHDKLNLEKVKCINKSSLILFPFNQQQNKQSKSSRQVSSWRR